MGADVKGDAYEGLLEKNAQDTKSGAGQYFTPRSLIKAMVDAISPKPGETICDPACGTAGFLLAAHDYLVAHNVNLTKTEKKHLKDASMRGWELVQSTARLAAMNMMLHGIGSEASVPIVVADALAADRGDRFDIVLANPPFGKKSSTQIEGADGKRSTEKDVIERDDFWATTSNKQLNFVQHIKTLLKQNGRAAVVLPDNVLSEGGAGEEAAARMRCAHAAAFADRIVLRAGRESERDFLRSQTRLRNAVDQEGVDLRSAHQQTLHAQDGTNAARRPG